MKERDYINVRDLGRVIEMETLLRDIVVSVSISKITEEDYHTVARILSVWREDLFKVVNTE